MPEPGITVVGHGSAAGGPDVATLTLGAESMAATPGEAFDAVSQAMAAMIAAVDAAGVAPADRQTSGANLRSAYDHEGRGFVASQQLTTRVRDVAGLGALVGAAVHAGGHLARLHGLGFGFSDPAEARRQARDAAFADARDRADQYAALAGRSLGAVRRVNESGGGYPRMFVERGGAVAAGRFESMSVEAGSVEVMASVEVEWEFAD